MNNDLYTVLIELSKPDGTKFYTNDGCKVPHIQFMETIYRDFDVYCKRTFRYFEAITGTSKINISILGYSEMTKTHPCLYSFYGMEQRFITH